MPIRMTDDPNQTPEFDDRSGGGGRGGFPGGGGGGGLMSLLPLLLGLFKGKGIIFLLILGVGAWFLLGRGGCNTADIINQFSQSGYSFNKDTFDKASVYEGLADDPNRNPLPEAVSLLRFAPARGSQGQQGSSVAWSCAYGAQTILTAAASGQDPNQIVFSPAYLYNQIRLEGCQGSYLQRAMESMRSNGGVPLRSFPYNDQDCQTEPDSRDIALGRQNVIHGFTRITDGDNVNEISVRGMK